MRAAITKGAPFLTYGTNAIYENQFLDYVITGEPEQTFKEILEGIPNSEILGISYKDNFQGITNEPRPFNENLDECKVLFDNDTRKVYADEYWDDKSIGAFCYYDFSKKVTY